MNKTLDENQRVQRLVVQDFGLGGLGFRAWGSEFRASGLEFRAWGLGFGVRSLGCSLGFGDSLGFRVGVQGVEA